MPFPFAYYKYMLVHAFVCMHLASHYPHRSYPTPLPPPLFCIVGMDAGGVTREWYQILTQQMFNPNYALFNTIHGNIFQPNPQSHINPDHLAYFKFIGRVVGE
ncbi:hypothetical protein EON65_05525 [archaeon]|nr:MAG: hypothetical protein EON65_05525 [archaeon]